MNKGFAVKCWEKQALEWKSSSIPMCSGCSFLYHPKAQKTVNHLMKTAQNDYNSFEIGCLLSYRIQDAYVYSFGSNQGKRAYPNKTFTEEASGYSASLLWHKLGLNSSKYAW